MNNTADYDVTEEDKQVISRAYGALLEKRGGRPRQGQKHIMAAVARAVAAAKRPADEVARGDRHLAANAPTGTGKSFAFVLGAFPGAQRKGLKIVISTATVSLQDQLMQKDLPLLAEVLPALKAGVVKGRGRYVCPARLEEQAKAAKDPELREAAIGWVSGLDSGAWDGELDSVLVPPAREQWQAVTTDALGCTGSRCPKFEQCPFHRARRDVADCNVLVTNHAMLIAEAKSGFSVLPQPENAVIVIDEADQLPQVCLSQLAGCHALGDSRQWALEASQLLVGLRTAVGSGECADKAALVWSALQTLAGALAATEYAIRSNVRGEAAAKVERFRGGRLPDWLKEAARDCRHAAEDAQKQARDLLDCVLGDGGADMKPDLRQRATAEVGSVAVRADSIVALWHLISADQMDGAPVAKWVSAGGAQADVTVAASPTGVGEYLNETLWQRAAASIHLSATLVTVGGFAPYLRESGLAHVRGVQTVDVESPYDHAKQATLIVPRIANPKERERHTEDLSHMVKRLIRSHPRGEGGLVLFTSWEQMRNVYDALDVHEQARVLVQDTLSKRQLLEEHRRRVEAGETSFIMATAGLEAGLDLPGALCTLVVAAKLAFAPPTDPVGQTHEEHLEASGRSYFDDVMVPRACRRLIQAAGRLLRSEMDSGRIVVADTRLTDTGYGRRMLKALPPYRLSRSVGVMP